VPHRNDMSAWSGRVDPAVGELGYRWHQAVRSASDADGAGVAVVGFAGDVVRDGDSLEEAQREYAELMARLLRSGHFPIGLGGGHEIAWAAYQGIEQALGSDPRLERLGIINFDAHLDLRRPEVAGRGTPASRLLLADVAELSPVHDVVGRTARTAARLVYEIAAFSR
jgi:formiminoglutamase